jgi:hypothetical protein
MGVPYLFPYQQKQTPEVTPPSPPKEDSGGGFFGGVLDLLKNIPITIGGPANKSPISLGSYNQLTAGPRLLDFGRAQGLDLPRGSVSPGEAAFMVGEALKQRLTAPLGEEFATTMIPYPPGAKPLRPGEVGPVLDNAEPPENAGTRRLLALTPRSAAHQVLQDLMTTYGVLPGMNIAPIDTDAPLRALPTEAQQPLTQTPMTLPQPGQLGQPGQPASGPVSAVRPAMTTQEPVPTSAVRPALPTQEPRATSAVAPLATAPAAAPAMAGPTMPQMPPPYSRVVTQEQARAHPSVEAAQQLVLQAPNRKNQQALLLANANARTKILQERELAYREANKDFANTLSAWKVAMDANRPDYGLEPKELNTFAYARYGLPPGSRLTDAQTRQAMEDRDAHNLAVRDAETRATATAKGEVEEEQRQDLPLRVTLKGAETQYVNTQTGDTLPGTTKTKDAETLEAAGQAKMLSKPEQEELRSLRQGATILAEGAAKIRRLYDLSEGYLGRMTPEERLNPLQWMMGHAAQLAQDHPEVIETQRFFKANTMVLARALEGAKGRMNLAEFEAAKQGIIPQLDYSLGLGGKLASFFGLSLPTVGVTVPDTREAALGTMDMAMNLINSHGQTLLGNDAFQFKGMTPRTEEERARARLPALPPRTPEGLLPGQEPLLPAPVKTLIDKGKKLLGLPTTQPPSGYTPLAPPPGGRGPDMSGVVDFALKSSGQTTRPDARTNPQGFQQFMRGIRTRLGQLHPEVPPEALDKLVSSIAQKNGGVWRPQP